MGQMRAMIRLCMKLLYSVPGRDFVRLGGRVSRGGPAVWGEEHDHTSRGGEDLASSTSAACDAHPEKVRHNSLERGHKSHIVGHFFGFCTIRIP